METNQIIKGLFDEAIQSHDHSLKTALTLGLVQVADLSETDGKHRNALIGLCGNLLVVPDRFIKTASPPELSVLLGGDLNKGVAQAEVDVRLARNDAGILAHIIDADLYRKAKEGWPENIQKLVAPILSDPTKTNDSKWDSVRRNMSEEHQQEVVNARSLWKRKATMAAIAAGERAAVKHTDPLLEAIAKADVKRMRGLDLEELKPDRWEKAKADWLSSPSVGIRAFLTRLPLALSAPHMKEALEAAAEANLDRWLLPAPKWPIPKAVLKTLTPSALSHWLEQAVRGRVGFDAPITGAELAEDLSPMLVMAMLSDANSGKIAQWIDGLRKARKLCKFVGAKSNLTKEETKMLGAIKCSLTRLYISESPVLTYVDGESCGTLKVIRWLLSMNDADLTRLAGAFLGEPVIKESIDVLFPNTSTHDFAEDI
jgi:hypothetical protein